MRSLSPISYFIYTQFLCLLKEIPVVSKEFNNLKLKGGIVCVAAFDVIPILPKC